MTKADGTRENPLPFPADILDGTAAWRGLWSDGLFWNRDDSCYYKPPDGYPMPPDSVREPLRVDEHPFILGDWEKQKRPHETLLTGTTYQIIVALLDRIEALEADVVALKAAAKDTTEMKNDG